MKKGRKAIGSKPPAPAALVSGAIAVTALRETL
jgi:hypothetical protein